MKKLLISIIILLLSTGLAGAQNNLEKRFTVSPGEKIDIDINIGAKVDIKGWDKNEVYVKASNRRGDWDDYDVEIEQHSGTVTVDVNGDWYYRNHRSSGRSRIVFDISVPKKFDARIKLNGGDIVLDNLDGTFRGKTMGGDLELSNLKGRVQLSTMGGEISVKDSEIDGRVSTMGGEVLVQDVTGNLDASSMGGNVIHKNFKDRSGRSTGNEVRIKTMGGSIRKDNAPDGANVHTMGGDIRIRSAKKYVKAVTMGGDIEIDKLDGWIEAKTYAGDIEVTIIGDSKSDDHRIELVSFSGDIDLILPKDLSMDIEAEIEYTRNSRGDYRIESDFKLDIEESKEWEDPRDRWDGDRKRRWSRRDLRKYISGNGSTTGKKNKVFLRTINGNIYIKKGN